MAGMVRTPRLPVNQCNLHANPRTAAALQYYHTAMLILDLAKPQRQDRPAVENIQHITKMTRNLERRASEICALALSSDSQAVWINAFGPIAFCTFDPPPLMQRQY